MDIGAKILYEDNHLLAIHKPSGLLSQGDNTGDVTALELIKDYIKIKYKKPGDVYLGLVHRLDRPVSGILLTARTTKALTRMQKQWQEHKVKKIYIAIVSKLPATDSGILTHYLIKDESKNVVKAYDLPKKDAKEATLHYQLLGYAENYPILRIELGTGRSHQIRAQLAAIQCPIVGDKKYHGPEAAIFGLHAYQLIFTHPTLLTEVNIKCRPEKKSFWINADAFI